jgi:shikimate dehydrogenase
MKIDGSTKIYGIIGDPIKHVAVPKLMNALYEKNAENKILIPFHVKQYSLESIINGLKKIQNFKGAVITMPHKTEIVKYIDEAPNEVQRIGACNVIKRTTKGTIKGDLLDGNGFVQGLKSNNHSLKAKNIFLLGCGGAASAISYALCENKIKKLAIYNRTKSKAIKLIEKLKLAYPNIEIYYNDNISKDIDILINATPVGMKENDKPILSLSNINSKTLVAEIITSPEITCTLKAALEKGCKIHKGIAMLEGQIKLMNEFMD